VIWSNINFCDYSAGAEATSSFVAKILCESGT
jgi:hypothetical protein